MTDQSPPHSLDLEKVILGSALEWEHVAPGVRENHFYRIANQQVWRAIRAAVDLGLSPGYAVVRHTLREQDTIESVGEIYLNELARDNVRPTESTLRSVVQQLGDLHRRRQVFELLRRETSAPHAIDPARIITDLEPLCTPVADPDRVLFRTARQIAEATSQKVEWIVPGFIAAGAITELTGKAKAAGKTTLLSYLCRCVLDGEPCLGNERAMQSPIVFLTEQGAHTFSEFLRRAGLLERNRETFKVLDYWSVNGRPWAEIARLAHQQADRMGARLIVVDTLAQFAGLRGEAENNAGDALAALEPLQRIAAAGIGVVLTRHERKGGGEVGESGRGSSAFTGAVDVVLSLKRPEGRHRPTLRVLEGLSRFDETPAKLTIELVSGFCADTGIEVCAQSFRVLGDTDAVALDEVTGQLERLLPASEGDALTMAALEKATGAPRKTLQRALKNLAGVQFIGKGKKGDPQRWFKPLNVSAQTAIPRGTKAQKPERQAHVLSSPKFQANGRRARHGHRGEIELMLPLDVREALIACWTEILLSEVLNSQCDPGATANSPSGSDRAEPEHAEARAHVQ